MFFFKSFGTLGSCHFTKGLFFSCGKEGFVFFHLFSVLLLLVFIKKLDLGPFVKGLHLTWGGKKKRIKKSFTHQVVQQTRTFYVNIFFQVFWLFTGFFVAIFFKHFYKDTVIFWCYFLFIFPFLSFFKHSKKKKVSVA